MNFKKDNKMKFLTVVIFLGIFVFNAATIAIFVFGAASIANLSSPVIDESITNNVPENKDPTIHLTVSKSSTPDSPYDFFFYDINNGTDDIYLLTTTDDNLYIDIKNYPTPFYKF